MTWFASSRAQRVAFQSSHPMPRTYRISRTCLSTSRRALATSVSLKAAGAGAAGEVPAEMVAAVPVVAEVVAGAMARASGSGVAVAGVVAVDGFALPDSKIVRAKRTTLRLV